MKNLKKVLALGLALVMLLGMFTIASAATTTTKMVASDLTDWDTVEHKDAVALMVDLGIINGKDDGSFDPTANITRGEWSKMVYYAATGDDNADAYLGAATNLTDIAGHWAEGYICYMASTGRVSGDGTGHFNPDNNVTVVEACKMMLTTLGYDADDRGYQNDTAWSGNIMRDAKRFGLMDNVDAAQTTLVPLTRENAAEIVYNALQVNMVEAVPQWDAGNKYITTYDELTPLGYDVFGVIRVEATVNSIDTDGHAVFGTITYPEDLPAATAAATSKLENVTASAKLVGQTVSIFVEATNVKSVNKLAAGDTQFTSTKITKAISTSVASAASAADETFTQGFNWFKVDVVGSDEYVAQFAGADTTQDDVDNRRGAGMTTSFYLNGGLLGTGQTGERSFRTSVYPYIWDTANAEGIPGIVVEFYLNDEGKISTVKAYDHSVAQLTGDVETRTNSGTLQVRVPGVVSTWTDADKVNGYQGLLEDDVVLWYRTKVSTSTNDYIYVIEKAEKVTGKVTAANSSNQITVNGTKYKRTGLSNVSTSDTEGYGLTGKTFADWSDRDNEFDFYLDKAGAVCFVEKVTDAATKDKVALVMAAEWTGTDMTTSTGLLQAKLLFLDGTTEIVTVSKLDDLKVVTTHSTNATTAAKEIIGGPKEASKITDSEDVDGEEPAIAKLHDTKLGGVSESFFTYRVVDGKYELTRVVNTTATEPDDGWENTVSASGVSIKRENNFTQGAISLSANANTTFLVAKGEEGEEEYYTYTSFRNIPEMTDASVLAVSTADNSGVAKYVFLTTISYNDDVPDGLIFIRDNKWEEDPDNEDCYLINVVNETGEVTQLSVTESIRDMVATDSTGSLAAWQTTNKYVGHFFQIDRIDEDGVVSEMTDVGKVGTMANVTAMGGDVVKGDAQINVIPAGGSATDSLGYDSITKFVYIDLAVDDKDDTLSTDDDTLVFSDAGTFDPERFYNSTNVNAAPELGTTLVSNATKSYDSVQVLATHAADSSDADFVYVVRVCW